MASASDGHRVYVDARDERDEMQKKSNNVINELVRITEHLIANKEEIMIVINEKDQELQNEKRLKNELHEDFVQLCHDITEINERNTKLAFQLDDKRLQVTTLSQKEKKLTMQCAANQKEIFKKQTALKEAQAKHADEVALLKMEYENKIHAMEDTIETKAFEIEELKINLEEVQEEMKGDQRHEIEKLICQRNNWKTAYQQSEYGYEVLRQKHEESKIDVKLLKEKIKDEAKYEDDVNNNCISNEDNTEKMKDSGMSGIHAMEVESVKTNALIVEKHKEVEMEKELKNEDHEIFPKVCHDISEINERDTNQAFKPGDERQQIITLSQKEKKLTMQCAGNEKEIFEKQTTLDEAQAKHVDEFAMLEMEYENKIHAMEDTIETKAFEIEELKINLEEVQEEMKGDQRHEIEKLICQRNNWKTAYQQSEYGYEILRQKHEESKIDVKLLKEKIKDEAKYEDDVNNNCISNEDNTEKMKDSGMSGIHAMEVESVKTNALIVEKHKEVEMEKELKNEDHEIFPKVCHDISEINERDTNQAFKPGDERQQIITLSQKEKKLTMQCAGNEKEIFEKQTTLDEAQAKHVDEFAMLKRKYENKIHAMEDTIETKAFEIEELKINLEEVQEEMKGDQRHEIEKLICQRNNWKTAYQQSEYGYEILRQKHEESKIDVKLLKEKIKDEAKYEDDVNINCISNEDNTEELKSSGKSLTQVDSFWLLPR